MERFGSAQPSSWTWSVFFATVMAAVISPTAISAQAFDVAYQAHVWHSSDRPRLHGILLRLGWENGPEASLEAAASGWSASGNTCAGLITDPNECPLEDLSFSSQTLTSSLGHALVNVQLPWGTFSTIPNVGLTLSRVAWEGLATGRSLDDLQVIGELAVTLRFRTETIRDGLRAFLEYRIGAGVVLPEACEDCGRFDGGNSRQALAIGLTLGGV